MNLVYDYKSKCIDATSKKFENNIEKLLKTIETDKIFPEHDYDRMAINQVIRETEDRLDEFLEIKKLPSYASLMSDFIPEMLSSFSSISL